MNKTLKITLWVVMVAAVVLMLFCGLHYTSLSRQFRETDAQHTASMEKWQAIAAEKETLEEELDTKNTELNRAKLDLEEYTSRAEELRKDIDTLQAEIEDLKTAGN